MNINSKKFNSIKPGALSSTVVSEDIHSAIKNWKKQLKDSEIIQDCYDRKFYQKPSTKKRIQLEIARYKQLKESER